MGGPIPALVALLAAAALRTGTGTAPGMGMGTGTETGTAPPGLWLLEPPRNASAAPGASVRFRCRVRGAGPPPELGWSRDGSPVPADTDLALVPTGDGAWIGATELRLVPVQGSHSGRYRCWARAGGQQLLSPEAHLELAGLPQFEEEPQDAEVPLGGALTLRCAARGPPEPVRLRWLRDGAALGEPAGNGSATLRLSALSRSSTITCEAHNARGVATSRGATITVVPQPPRQVALLGRGSDWLELGWELGEAGPSPVGQCRVQAEAGGRVHERAAPLPPPALRLAGLRPFTRYRLRVRCGASPWSQWERAETLEGAPGAPPENVTLERAGGRARARWAPPSGQLNGALRGFRLRYGGDRDPEVELDVGLAQEQSLELQQNLWVRVAPYTAGGEGPWSPRVRLPPIGETPLETQPVLPAVALPGAHWPPVVAAVAVVALVALVALGVLGARRWRRKKPHYGVAFAPHGEPVVQFRVRSSYSRRSTNALLSRLGISEELQEKLRDVTLDRHRLALGKTLGEGEFGSVMEGQLQQESGVLRVAVKTMKVAMGSRAQLEQFLTEAACMKEFDHPNVMSLIGVCLQPWGDGGLPAPIVVLPFMAHGDLHSFLLRARLGQPPLALAPGTLLRFLRDIAAGMEYLSLRNFIHRDLAARNCMLDERLRVLVADFGLAKRLGGGQYYRQGHVAPVPVKWVALESLESRVYSTKSDVWSFGVTMWEVLARGRTPYPGLENGDVYEYLRGGRRLRAPPGCPPAL